MRTPTANEIRIAVNVLQALSERIHTNAADQLMQLPESSFSNRHAARIEDVIAQLNDWKVTIRQNHGVRL
jgi:hypothetical protein